MIRTRLSVAFAAMALLAVAQGLFVLWATQSAAKHAERSLVATNMLNHYLELGANKQRLKVWFAESSLADTALEGTRDKLLEKMAQSLGELQKLLPRDAAVAPGGVSTEFSTLQLLQRNFGLLKTSLADSRLKSSQPIAANQDKGKEWTDLMAVFDRSDGLDLRTVLEQAVVRQRATSDRAEAELATELARIRSTSAWLTLTAAALGVFAVIYFVKRMQKPFESLVRTIGAMFEGNYDATSLPLKSHGLKDEFGLIAQQLEGLAAKLAVAREQNEHLRQGLDDAVAAKIADVTRSHEALMRVDIRRRQFFTEVSHELRTPVTVIRGEAEVALRAAANSDVDYRACLKRIVDASNDLGTRVQDLLTIAVADDGPYSMQLGPTPIGGVLRSVLQQMAAVAENRNISLSNADEAVTLTVDSAVVKADADRLKQALTIVLDNAVRYSQADSRIDVTATVDEQQRTVNITIKDHGIGLTEGESQGVFERHFRGQAARQMRPDGAGLGLSIAQAIVLAHDGAISIQNNLAADAPGQRGQGAQVTICLPLVCTGQPGAALQALRLPNYLL